MEWTYVSCVEFWLILFEQQGSRSERPRTSATWRTTQSHSKLVLRALCMGVGASRPCFAQAPLARLQGFLRDEDMLDRMTPTILENWDGLVMAWDFNRFLVFAHNFTVTGIGFRSCGSLHPIWFSQDASAPWWERHSPAWLHLHKAQNAPLSDRRRTRAPTFRDAACIEKANASTRMTWVRPKIACSIYLKSPGTPPYSSFKWPF